MRVVRAWSPAALSALAMLSLSMAVVRPATAADLKIGVVNVSTLLQDAPQSKTMSEALKTEFAPKQRELLNMQQALKKEQDQYQRDSSIMGEDERADLERKIRDDQRDLQRAGQQFQQDVNDRKNEELAKLQRTLLQEVQTYARSKNYDLVISDVLYFSDSVDITKEVLAAMKKNADKKK